MAKSIRDLAVSQRGVVFDAENGESFSVNHTGTYVIRALQTGSSIEDLISTMQDTWYQADATQIRNDVIGFVEKLKVYNLY